MLSCKDLLEHKKMEEHCTIYTSHQIGWKKILSTEVKATEVTVCACSLMSGHFSHQLAIRWFLCGLMPDCVVANN